MSQQDRDLFFCAALSGATILLCLSGMMWAVRGSIQLIQGEQA